MGREKEKEKESKKENDDAEIRRSERLAAAKAVAAAASVVATKVAAAAAAAAAPAAAAPAASNALPDIISTGRFRGYMSPEHWELSLWACKEELREMLEEDREDRVEWQKEMLRELTEEILVQVRHRHRTMNEICSARTDAPSETTNIAAAAAAADTSAVAAVAAAATVAADATTNDAATTIARLEHELGEMAAAAAAAAATADAAAVAAAEEIARLEQELDETTHWLKAAYTPKVFSKVFFPAPRDPKERDRWDAWCNSIPWGNSPAATPTQQTCHTDTQDRREHLLNSHSASGSAQPSVPAPATRKPTPTPTPTLTPTSGNSKSTRAHTSGVSTHCHPAPSLQSSVRPTLHLQPLPTTSMPLSQLPQRSVQDQKGTRGIPPRREQPSSSQPAFGSVQPEVSNLNRATHDRSVHTGSTPRKPTDTPTQPHENDDLLTSLVNALSAAAAATAAAAAASTDKLEITTTAAVAAAIADALSDYQATRPPPKVHRRGGRPPRKAPSRPRAHRQTQLSDAEAVPVTEPPHRRGGWRPPRRVRGWTALQPGDGQ